MKKLLTSILALSLSIAVFAGCNSTATPDPAPATTEAAPASEEAAPASEEAPAESTEADPGTKPYIAVISKGFQHQFWQTVNAGANAAAAEYNVDITFEGPPTESDISIQVDMLNAALAKNPAAVALAALDTESVTSQLTQAMDNNIPVVGFDSGVPNAPAGSVVSTASTNNYEAGKLAAQQLFDITSVNEKIVAATADAPVLIVAQSQDATSASILDRTNGFVDEIVNLANGVHANAVEVTGHDVFLKPSTNPAAVIVKVVIPPSTSYTDAQAVAQTELQNNPNLIAYYCSNEASVTGMLAATNDGTDLDRANGTYKDLIVIGFDAGAPQKNAIKNQYFYGAVTQDPYMIGFYAVELAYKAISGEAVEEVVDTGCRFYTYENMEDPEIAQLLYD
ncbi:MAG: ABC transporter substrate-binding protein [Clostridiales bacterium]|jgi:ribose transport system substrate-binding protein|nr:ABC transporter substrate-binding protein [Clostridiales bacterium]